MITILLTLFSAGGSTICGSILKIVSGFLNDRADQKVLREKREHVNQLTSRDVDSDAVKAIYAEHQDEETIKYTLCTRRYLAFMGMLVYGVIGVICTIYPSVPLQTFRPKEFGIQNISLLWGLIDIPKAADMVFTVTTGHLVLVQVSTLGMILGFYFTPSGRR